MNQAKGEFTRRNGSWRSIGSRVVVNMGERLKQDASDPLLDATPTSFYGYALLAEGSELDDSPKFKSGAAAGFGKSDLDSITTCE